MNSVKHQVFELGSKNTWTTDIIMHHSVTSTTIIISQKND